MGFTNVWNLDQSRAAIEELPPHLYLEMSYYEKWALRLQNLVVRHGLVDNDEIEAGRALRPGKPLPRRLVTANVDAAPVRGDYGRDAGMPARFQPGDRVRTRNIHPATHTRLPRYVRGRVGVVEQVRGCHVFPDSAAIGEGEKPQWLYTVRFDGTELWGEDSDPNVSVSIEAFEPYLEAA
jgi:nitrile hydratase